MQAAKKFFDELQDIYPNTINQHPYLCPICGKIHLTKDKTDII